MEIRDPMSKVDKEAFPHCCTYFVGGQQADRNAAIRSIVFPEAGKLRSREVVSRSSARPKGKYPSWKIRRMVQWESENELNAFRLLDCDPDVTRYFHRTSEFSSRLIYCPSRLVCDEKCTFSTSSTEFVWFCTCVHNLT